MNEQLRRKIQILSFVAIIMVVTLHSYNLTTNFASGSKKIDSKSITSFVENSITHGVTRVAIPYFCVVAGYLFFQNLCLSVTGFRNKCVSRIKSLAVPYLLWAGLGFTFFYIIQSLPFLGEYFSNTKVTEYTPVQIIECILFTPMPAHLWFIRDLFLITLLSPVIYFLLSRLGVSVVVIVGIGWFMNLGIPFIEDGKLVFFTLKSNHIFYYFLKDGGLFFYLIGSLIAIEELEGRLSIRRPRWLLVLWLSIVSIDTYCFTAYGERIVGFHRAGIFIGTIAFWTNYSMVSWLFQSKQIYQLTFSRFFIYAFQDPFMIILKKLWSKIIGVSEVSNLLAYFICPLLVLSVSIMASVLLRKKVPRIYSILTGGR